jgi:hypothetical protein
LYAFTAGAMQDHRGELQVPQNFGVLNIHAVGIEILNTRAEDAAHRQSSRRGC